jgi:hypothetical protein
MNLADHPLRRLLAALMLGLMTLCVVAKPVVAAAHELHELQHATHGDMAADAAVDGRDGAPPDIVQTLLHAEDCCLHASAMPAKPAPWLPLLRTAETRPSAVPAPPAVPPSRMLRPPISV